MNYYSYKPCERIDTHIQERFFTVGDSVLPFFHYSFFHFIFLLSLFTLEPFWLNNKKKKIKKKKTCDHASVITIWQPENLRHPSYFSLSPPSSLVHLNICSNAVNSTRFSFFLFIFFLDIEYLYVICKMV